MRKMMFVLLLASAACSKAPDAREAAGEGSSAAVDTMNEAPGAPAGPGINVNAAPGVAFDYRYAFRLPASNIDRVQEEHARACEKLGVSRCRITGMRYSLTSDRQVAASLAFKLDPTLARGFGREGIAAIVRADGMLVDAEITGTDAGAEIERLDSSRAGLDDARSKIDRELGRSGLGNSARTELLRQRASLDEQVRSAGAAKSAQQASLARTPVSFAYESGRAIRGFDPRSPFDDALETLVDSAQWTLAFLLQALALLGPPALLAALLWLLWLRIRPMVGRRKREAAPPAD